MYDMITTNKGSSVSWSMNMSVSRWVGKVAVVTGASAGIGAAIALTLARAGLIVVGVARRVEKVEALQSQLKGAPGKLHARKADVSKEEDIKALFQWVKSELGGVHVLINNAGVFRFGKVINQSAQYLKDIFDTNVIGVTLCTQEAVKIMKENNVDGQIIIINSVLGHMIPTMPDMTLGIYPASKHAITALTEILRQELRSTSVNTNIKITSLSPGRVKTEFGEAANLLLDPQNRVDFSKMPKDPELDSQDLADAVMYILSTPPNVQVHELMLKPMGQMA